MQFVKQCKATDLKHLKVNEDQTFLYSRKYDGNYIQIHKQDQDIKIFSSSGTAQKFHETIKNDILQAFKNIDFIIECEYIADSKGILGDRNRSKLQNLNKDISHSFKVFEIIESNNTLKNSSMFEIVEYNKATLKEIKELLNSQTDTEGYMLKDETYTYREGKRVTNHIKVKNYFKKESNCIKVNRNEKNLVKSIELQCGAVVPIQSDFHKEQHDRYFLSNSIAFEYEFEKDGVYHQAILINIQI